MSPSSIRTTELFPFEFKTVSGNVSCFVSLSIICHKTFSSSVHDSRHKSVHCNSIELLKCYILDDFTNF